MESVNIEAIKDRIRKARAVAENPAATLGESAAAFAAAARLMHRYNLDEADLRDDHPSLDGGIIVDARLSPGGWWSLSRLEWIKAFPGAQDRLQAARQLPEKLYLAQSPQRKPATSAFKVMCSIFSCYCVGEKRGSSIVPSLLAGRPDSVASCAEAWGALVQGAWECYNARDAEARKRGSMGRGFKASYLAGFFSSAGNALKLEYEAIMAEAAAGCRSSALAVNDAAKAERHIQDGYELKLDRTQCAPASNSAAFGAGFHDGMTASHKTRTAVEA